jgi:hypothetical protein
MIANFFLQIFFFAVWSVHPAVVGRNIAPIGEKTAKMSDSKSLRRCFNRHLPT